MLTESRKLFGEVDPAAPGLKWTQPCSARLLAESILPRGGSRVFGHGGWAGQAADPAARGL